MLTALEGEVTPKGCECLLGARQIWIADFRIGSGTARHSKNLKDSCQSEPALQLVMRNQPALADCNYSESAHYFHKNQHLPKQNKRK